MLVPFDPLVVLHRVFPTARGLFEDKVSNFWCASNILIKWRQVFDVQTLLLLSLGLTLGCVMPACIALFRNPTMRSFRYATAITSLGFFLFSFQVSLDLTKVHEKTILVPLLPILMLFYNDSLHTATILFVNTALFSCFPLLRRDGLWLQACVYFVLFNVFGWDLVQSRLVVSQIFLFFSVFVAEVFVGNLPGLPDLWVVVNVLLSAGIFGLLFLYFYYCMLFGDNKSSKGAKRKVL